MCQYSHLTENQAIQLDFIDHASTCHKCGNEMMAGEGIQTIYLGHGEFQGEAVDIFEIADGTPLINCPECGYAVVAFYFPCPTWTAAVGVFRDAAQVSPLLAWRVTDGDA